jgi:hypothetical protein
MRFKSSLKIAVSMGLLCCATLTTQAAGQVAHSGGHAKSARVDIRHIDWLFVARLKKVKFEHISNKKYRLTFDKSAVRTIEAFSDRPARLAFTLGPARFAKMIHTGQDSFNEDPPNISVVFNASQDAAFEVKSCRVTKAAVQYDLVLLGKASLPNRFEGKVVIFCDSFWTNLTPKKKSADGGADGGETVIEGDDGTLYGADGEIIGAVI